MRIAMLVLLVSLSLVVTGAAQPLVKFGIKGGVTMADFSGDGWDDIADQMEVDIEHKFKMGFAAGAFVELPLGTGGLALHPELLYVMKGAKADLSAGDQTATAKIKQDYLEVPVLVKYNIPTAGKIAPSLFAGPVLAMSIGSKIEFDDVPAEAAEELEGGDIDNAKSIDFGIAFGGGLEVAVGPKGKLTFDLRYTLGLGDAFEDVDEADFDEDKMYLVDDETGDALKFKNTDIRFMVGYMF